ncbi:MAG: TolC family protein [Methylococcaceae bacterium]|nr:TolC family protein [Methylococcaceae bacterium]
MVQSSAFGAQWLEDPFDTIGGVGTSSAKPKPYPGEADPCLAQRKPDAPWSLLEIIDQALCHNPQTRKAWANARLQAAQVGSAEAAYLPSLTVSGSGTRSLNSASSVGTNLVSPIQTRFTPSIAFNYLLFDFGGRSAKLENARQALNVANWTHSASLQSTMFAAIQAYYQLFAAQSSVEAARETEVSTAKALEAARFRYQVGAAALADSLQAQTAHSQAKLSLRQAEGLARNALGTLANTMGLMPDARLQVAPPKFVEPDADREEDVRKLIEDARSARPDLAAAEAQIRADLANVQSARSAGQPTLSLVGSTGFNVSDVFRDSHNWSVGVQLNIPLFTGFSNTYQIRAAEEQVAVDEAARDLLEQSVGLAVWSSLSDLNTAKETVNNSEDLFASASQNEKVAFGRYQAGAGNIIDLLNAQASLASARYQRIQSRFNWSIARAKLAQAMGRLGLDAAREIPGSSSIHKGLD